MTLFSIAHLKPLVICRGPVRLEALQVFAQHGITTCGMLLSDKDSAQVPYGLAPELRVIPPGTQVHHIRDYQCPPVDKAALLSEIVTICKCYGYDSVFAGYGFMAEDPELAEAITSNGLMFIGPSASVSAQAGAKDRARQIAVETQNPIVPGEHYVLAKAWLWQHNPGLNNWQQHLPAQLQVMESLGLQLPSLADWIIKQPKVMIAAHVLLECGCHCIAELSERHPDYDLRIKSTMGGGGKGQRIIKRGSSQNQWRESIEAVWQEVKAGASTLAKNIVVELNLPLIRHWEIQLVGNGQWCVSLGGRDCSVQRHEQKLIEWSLRQDQLPEHEALLLAGLEQAAKRFGEAIGLDSVSTYEAIIPVQTPATGQATDQLSTTQTAFFMEMNTRLQVEHIVSELTHHLVFECPRFDTTISADTSSSYLVSEQQPDQLRVTQLIHLMCLLALYKHELPKPQVVLAKPWAIELRLNCLNQALRPAPGGLLQTWSPPTGQELRFDQGLGQCQPDSGQRYQYRFAGYYDSNIALILTSANSWPEALTQLLDSLQQMQLQGKALQTNLSALIGMLKMLSTLSEQTVAPIATRWIDGYLDCVAAVAEQLTDQLGLSLDPHRVLAYLLGESDPVLKVLPQQLSEQQLQQLHAIAPKLKLEQLNLVAGCIVGPKPQVFALDVLDPPVKNDQRLILAPMSGFFFERPSPDQEVFAVLGEPLEAGATVGLIEVMKMFYPIKIERRASLGKALVASGDMVQKGQALYELTP